MTTYAVHLPDGGTSEYENFAFSDAVKFIEKIYLLRPDGLYRFDGDTDNGAEIEASIGLGFDETGTRDHLPNVYLDANTDAPLVVAVAASQGVFEYETRSEGNDNRLHRADCGKGLKETKFYVFVRNTVGAAFTLFGATLNRIKGSRRI